MYGPRNRGHAKAWGLVRERDPNLESRGCGQRTTDKDIGERNFAWET